MSKYTAYCGLNCETCQSCGQIKSCEKLKMISDNNEIFSHNTVYFWLDTVKGLSEIRRCFVQGGCFINAVYTKEWLSRTKMAEKGFKKFDPEELVEKGKQAGFSDMIDGTIARKTGTESSFGAKLDSLADLIFVIVASIKILPSVSFIPIIWIWIGAIAAIKIYAAILIIRRKQEVFVHTIANKITGFLLFIWPFTVYIVDANYSAALVCVAATFACIQELILCKGLRK